MTAFRGFPRELFTFFEGLRNDNSKAYWTANKAIWETQVRQPMLALLADLADEFPPMRMFRPNRDVLFTKDRSRSEVVMHRCVRVLSNLFCVAVVLSGCRDRSPTEPPVEDRLFGRYVALSSSTTLRRPSS